MEDELENDFIQCMNEGRAMNLNTQQEPKHRNLNTQLKRLKTGNPRQYWAILNRMCNKRNTDNLPTDDELFEHFRNLNEAPDIPRKEEEEILDEALCIDTEELENDITETEVKT